MPEDTGLDCAYFDVVDADGVLVVGVGRQPGNQGGGGRHVTHADAGRRRRHLLADHHGARGVQRRTPPRRHRPHADPVRLFQNVPKVNRITGKI